MLVNYAVIATEVSTRTIFDPRLNNINNGLFSPGDEFNFLTVFWSFFSQIPFKELDDKSVEKIGVTVTSWISSHVSRRDLAWIGPTSPKKCDDCRSALLKILVTTTWSVVEALVKFDMPLELVTLIKTCILCLHYVWASDSESFVTSWQSTSPLVQRRYIWTINQIIYLKESKHLTLEQGKDNI